MHSIRSVSFTLSLSLFALGVPSFGQVNLMAGGGLQRMRFDKNSGHQERGYRGIVGLQGAGDHLGIALQGGYAATTGRDIPGMDSGSRSETRLFELHFLPKFYLRRGDVSAFAIGGGGPQWISREIRPGDGSAPVLRSSGFALGAQVGFGAEAAFSDAWAIGVMPSYHGVYGNGGREFEYVSITLYLRL